MCLRIFLARDRASDYDHLAPGARSFGAAFQKLNVLGDLADDHDALGRSYFPGLDVDQFCDLDRVRFLGAVKMRLATAALCGSGS